MAHLAGLSANVCLTWPLFGENDPPPPPSLVYLTVQSEDLVCVSNISETFSGGGGICIFLVRFQSLTLDACWASMFSFVRSPAVRCSLWEKKSSQQFVIEGDIIQPDLKWERHLWPAHQCCQEQHLGAAGVWPSGFDHICTFFFLQGFIWLHFFKMK